MPIDVVVVPRVGGRLLDAVVVPRVGPSML